MIPRLTSGWRRAAIQVVMFVALYSVLAVLLLNEPIHQAVVIAAGGALGMLAANHLTRKSGARLKR